VRRTKHVICRDNFRSTGLMLFFCTRVYVGYYKFSFIATSRTIEIVTILTILDDTIGNEPSIRLVKYANRAEDKGRSKSHFPINGIVSRE
jgi:hypothetical protein